MSLSKDADELGDAEAGDACTDSEGDEGGESSLQVLT